jgi:hypothetical protein
VTITALAMIGVAAEMVTVAILQKKKKERNSTYRTTVRRCVFEYPAGGQSRSALRRREPLLFGRRQCDGQDRGHENSEGGFRYLWQVQRLYPFRVSARQMGHSSSASSIITLDMLFHPNRHAIADASRLMTLQDPSSSCSRRNGGGKRRKSLLEPRMPWGARWLAGEGWRNT